MDEIDTCIMVESHRRKPDCLLPRRAAAKAGSFGTRTYEVLNFDKRQSQKIQHFIYYFIHCFIQSFVDVFQVKAFLGFPAHFARQVQLQSANTIHRHNRRTLLSINTGHDEGSKRC